MKKRLMGLILMTLMLLVMLAPMASAREVGRGYYEGNYRNGGMFNSDRGACYRAWENYYYWNC